MAKSTDIPEFGLLSGYKVVMIGTSVAAPFAGELYAEHGADVIWIEHPTQIGNVRIANHGASTQQDRRNMRSLAIDYTRGEGQQVFLRLIKSTDVLIEASVGGRFANQGLSDETLWKHNPGLVITHISGFGQTGVPDYMRRASYDPIAQAFGCTMRMNGLPGHPSVPAMAFPGDYASAFFAFGMSVAALLKREKTASGESIDVAQFEAMIRTQANYPMNYWRDGKDYVKEGSHSLICALYGTYVCSDGKEVYVLFLGTGVVKRGLPLIGIEYGTELFPEGMHLIPYGSEAGELAEQKFSEFLSMHTADEVEDILAGNGVPCSKLMDYESAKTNPQYVARNVISHWNSVACESLPGVKIVPELKNYPGKIWRGAPAQGMDSNDILEELGYSDKEIQELHCQRIIGTFNNEESGIL